MNSVWCLYISSYFVFGKVLFSVFQNFRWSTNKLEDLRFSRRWLWRMPSSGMLRRVALTRACCEEMLQLLFTPNVVPSSPIPFMWCWRRHIPPKRRFLQESRGITSQKTASWYWPPWKLQILHSTNQLRSVAERQCVSCKIWGFHGGDYEEWCLLGCYAVWLLSHTA
jgi:hypothetical protein